MDINKFIQSGMQNIPLFEEMYQRYLVEPLMIDDTWAELFFELEHKKFPRTQSVKTSIPSEREEMDVRIEDLINAYRRYGHLIAKLNPLKENDVSQLPEELQLEAHGLSEDDLERTFPTMGLMQHPSAKLRELIEVLHQTYCGSIGFEFKDLQSEELSQWLQDQIESSFSHHPLFQIEEKRNILQQLNKSELFEVFLHTKYPGQKRFSLEGAETLIPMLHYLMNDGARLGVEKILIGMAHRGRLNVLANILNKSYHEIFSEFDEHYIPSAFEGSGDVKYHKGFFATVAANHHKEIVIELPPNPSHLESVNGVLLGETKALQDQLNTSDANEHILPLIIHGDAAISGQGVVYETMQFCRLKGYDTGGTIHIVINNQIGFTTHPEEGRSTFYCTDIAKAFGVPVFHVNAEDPEACVFVTLLANRLRQRFHTDVFIDMICYRKYGHNEGDEPAFTQPRQYRIIKKKHPIREIYRDRLINEGIVEREIAEKLEEEFKESLNQALQRSKEHLSKQEEKNSIPKYHRDHLFQQVTTAVPQEALHKITKKLTSIPNNLNVHRKLVHLMEERRVMGTGEKPIDWGMAEMLAYGSLLLEGYPIRIAGQDVQRGTFSHRHAVLVDQETGEKYFPLKHLEEGQADFSIYNSPLSEYAALAFDYGYSVVSKGLVIWEAQFGDFSNGAQIIIDQYIASSEQKWGQKTNLTLFLPHGYEGQGPEHSSARMERYLTLAGNDNFYVANVTTPAQLFHLLRRQILNHHTKPLILFTPKGLLRHPECLSALEDFSHNSFQEILEDKMESKNAKTILICSGRIYYDLCEERKKRGAKELAIIRVEQLYPFHEERMRDIVSGYPELKNVMWVQEEPKNMGAWSYIQPELAALLPNKVELQYIGRKRSASPAAGSHALHQREHQEIMESIFSTYEHEIGKQK
ncbi:MAG: hypothetical protein Tsb0021_04290 [Chlamydiales bacterium]